MFNPFSRKSTLPRAAARIYLDYAAATPVSVKALAAMGTFYETHYGNASAVHSEGQAIRHIIQAARVQVARLTGVQSDQVLFTSGGTESNNLAIIGVVEALALQGRAYADMEIITTMIEHPATKNAVAALAAKGVRVGYVSVDENGIIVLPELATRLNEKTVLVCVSYVNSEIGTIEAVGAVSRVIHKQAPQALLFVDAAQAPLWLPCVLSQLRADIMAFDAGKFGGPQGIGMLIIGKRVVITPIVFGGGQERGLRPGTEPAALIVGAAAAFVEAQTGYVKRAEETTLIRDYALTQLQNYIPDHYINGARGTDRVANNINISIPGIDSEYAVITLDVHGVACSTKSACSSAGGGQSAVVMAVSKDAARASSTLRFTLGPTTTRPEIDTVLNILRTHLNTTARI